jgi:hypothetical protein
MIPEEAFAQLPTGEVWGKQLASERSEYEREWEGRSKGAERFNPYENLYSKPRIPFGPYFIKLSETNFGTSPIGAFCLYRTLCSIPEGYSYHGIVEAARVTDYQDLGAKIVSQSAHDLDGNPMSGYVSIAVQKVTPQSK